MSSLIVVILAAGKGTRMKSELPKVAHPVADKPMLSYTIDLAKGLTPEKIAVVVSADSEIPKLFNDPALTFCVQKEQSGTADAVLAAKPLLDGYKGNVLILCGDMPNIQADTVSKFISAAKLEKASFITVKSTNPKGYGRVVRGIDHSVYQVVEEKDANEHEKKITEINTGVYYMAAELLLERLAKVGNSNAQNEYYLTDILKDGSFGWLAEKEAEFLGVNDRVQLAQLSRIIWKSRATKWMEQGVSIINPDDVYLSPDVTIAQDVTIYPNVYLQGKTTINKGCTLYSGVRIVDSAVDEGCVIKENTLIEESHVGAKCNVGPMAHLRPHSTLVGENSIGNFVEIKNATVGKGSKANHLTYLGDATIGVNTNVGCGTITCNYDGFKKHHTTIGDNVFVGSDVQFVAPITVGDGAIVAAGTTVTADIPNNALAIARTPQKNLDDKAGSIRLQKGGKR
ncbi:MAG: bifunctional UDP-N-acetylglucosamine diphosphorylase/glucosamine-1-phosphate N-acetyltransferase GlmU [Deferribacteraceae bacterium]|jgi:bifunctional UDP-N-acetylglucosamine pyrophosphorylase/glucosamine-1-phosphate N-acetyltransferase|nr:bifunctional UDP-N-acetylglucosamine diphosphorylase/glucosamine-1-phosphate N-acetyltransferase GlmU [Deferribacteraceae bacterium]